jgi:hypothetical protein
MAHVFLMPSVNAHPFPMCLAFPNSEYNMSESDSIGRLWAASLAFWACRAVEVHPHLLMASRVHTSSFAACRQFKPRQPFPASPLMAGPCCLPPRPREVNGCLILTLSELISVHLRYGLHAPCVRFTGLVLCGIHLAVQMGFHSPPFRHRSYPHSAQHSVLNYWLGFIEAGFTACRMMCASRRTGPRKNLWVSFAHPSHPRW